MTPDIAITRVALATGFGADAEETWRQVVAGASAVRSADGFDGAYVSQLDGADVLMTLVKEVAPEGLPADTGVAIGTNGAPEAAWLSGKPYAVLDDVADSLGARGPRVVFGTGCVAGTNALCYAIDALRAGVARTMVVIGVESLTVTTMATFRSWKAIDPAPSRPYGGSGGVNLGEGAAVLVLTADPKEEDVIAYVNGYGLTSDAFHVTSPPRDGEGLHRALRIALRDAGVAPSDVDYVNGHGTGTPANDTAELAAMRAVFGQDAPPISSSKPQVGHTLGAAGAVEAALTALAIRDQVLPPTANVAPDAPVGDWDVVPNRSRPARIDVAVTNSLAFGGANGVVVLGRHPRRAADTDPERPVEVRGFAEVADLDTALTLIPRAYAGRAGELGALAMAAGKAAWTDAGFTAEHRPDAERVGLVFATAEGPVGTIEELFALRERGELELISPVTAPNIVASVTAGYVCQQLGIKGPLSAITSGADSESIAEEYARGLVARGRADVVLVVSADERGGGARARVLAAAPRAS
ncbi:beta-ketoacyl synthase N-terminal-like domain-containing protein [Streptomyces sp. NPDC048297]|uniref:beta-ketoacyl synthase N-terminal-like domain-containing protein n=1 Tax=Streptomyces sp. NPDC048297 TaxID=3365531 RepID=UPI003723E3AC